MKLILWDDINIHVEVEYHEARMEFKMFEVHGHSQDGPEYPREGNTGSGDTVNDRSKAEAYITGTIKWDACSHLYFGTDNGYMHICGGRNWKNLITALERVFALAREYFNEPHQKEMFDDYDE